MTQTTQPRTLTKEVCSCPEFPGENRECPVHYPVVTFDDCTRYAKQLPINIAKLVYPAYNRELTMDHAIEAWWTINNLYKEGGAPEWLFALASGNFYEFDETADEVREMLIREIGGGQ